MHHKGKAFPFYLPAKGINLNFIQDFVVLFFFFLLYCGITVFFSTPVGAPVRHTSLLNIITAAKSSTGRTGNARIQVWLPASIHYDINFIITSAFECYEFFMLRIAPTEDNLGSLNPPQQCPHLSIA